MPGRTVRCLQLFALAESGSVRILPLSWSAAQLLWREPQVTKHVAGHDCRAPATWGSLARCPQFCRSATCHILPGCYTLMTGLPAHRLVAPVLPDVRSVDVSSSNDVILRSCSRGLGHQHLMLLSCVVLLPSAHKSQSSSSKAQCPRRGLLRSRLTRGRGPPDVVRWPDHLDAHARSVFRATATAACCVERVCWSAALTPTP